MCSGYYLRSYKKKGDPPQQVSRMKLSSEDMEQKKHLKVCLNRNDLLEIPENHKNTFKVTPNGFQIKKKYFFSRRKIILLILLSLVTLTTSILFFTGAWPTHGPRAALTIINRFSNNLHNLSHYNVNLIINKWSNRFGLGGLAVTTSNRTTTASRMPKKKKNVCYYDIRDFVKEHFSGPKLPPALIETRKLSFIEEQCLLVRVEPKLADNFEPSWNLFQKVEDIEVLQDYASYNKGARVLRTYAEPYVKPTVHFPLLDYVLGVKDFYVDLLALCRFSPSLCRYFTPTGPTSVLQPWRYPGECWSFRGSTGRMQIQLSERIYISALTLEHIPNTLATDASAGSAPKRFSIVGIDDTEARFTARYPLGTYQYQSNGPNVQTFSLPNEYSLHPYKIIEFIIESNHGNEEYTCVYRLRVHGHPLRQI